MSKIQLLKRSKKMFFCFPAICLLLSGCGLFNNSVQPHAFVETDNVSFDVIYEYENDRYSATLYDKNGNPQRPYLNSENLEELIGQILETE